MVLPDFGLNREWVALDTGVRFMGVVFSRIPVPPLVFCLQSPIRSLASNTIFSHLSLWNGGGLRELAHFGILQKKISCAPGQTRPFLVARTEPGAEMSVAAVVLNRHATRRRRAQQSKEEQVKFIRNILERYDVSKSHGLTWDELKAFLRDLHPERQGEITDAEVLAQPSARALAQGLPSVWVLLSLRAPLESCVCWLPGRHWQPQTKGLCSRDTVHG